MAFVLVVRMTAPEGQEARAAELIGRLVEATRQEPGNVRWDLSQSEEDPTRFFLYEVYRTKDDFPKHQQTPHYLTWKSTVADWMAQPRLGVRHQSVFFGDGET